MNTGLNSIVITILFSILFLFSCSDMTGLYEESGDSVTTTNTPSENNTVSDNNTDTENTITLSDSKEITAFSIDSPSITGTISGNTISFTVPFATDITALVAVFSTTGETVTIGSTEQISGTTVNDFTNSVVYTVTAENGSTINYTVTFSKENPLTGDSYTYSPDGIDFKMIFVEGGYTFPTGVNDDGTATVSNAYWIGETEVTYELWERVYNWATANGYTFANPGLKGNDGAADKSKQHPVTSCSWRDIIVWCNAVTEWYNAITGSDIQCVYYTDSNYTVPIRTSTTSTIITHSTPGTQDLPYVKSSTSGNIDIENCTAKGFRLLTRAEWECSAKYIDGTTWLPGNHVSGDISAPASTSTLIGNYSIYNLNSGDNTAEVCSKFPNFLSIYDMNGNVNEWNYDWDTSPMAGPGCYNGGIYTSGADCHGGPYWTIYFTGFRLGRSY